MFQSSHDSIIKENVTIYANYNLSLFSVICIICYIFIDNGVMTTPKVGFYRSFLPFYVSYSAELFKTVMQCCL